MQNAVKPLFFRQPKIQTLARLLLSALLLLMGIFYPSPKGGPISMILFWLLFVGILGLVNCTVVGISCHSQVPGVRHLYRRRFPWDKITEVWTGNEHIWWSGKTVNGKKERTCKNQFDHWGRSAKATGSKFPRIWRSNGLKIRRSGRKKNENSSFESS